MPRIDNRQESNEYIFSIKHLGYLTDIIVPRSLTYEVALDFLWFICVYMTTSLKIIWLLCLLFITKEDDLQI